MAEISEISLPSGDVYDLKDAKARSEIESIKNITGSGVIYRGTTNTAIVDGSTTATYTIGDDTTQRTAASGDMVSYNNVMFAWNGTQWDQLGTAGAFHALAYKDSVSGTITATGKVSSPAFTGKEGSISVTGTPKGSVSAPTFTGSETTSTGKFTPSGTNSAPTFTGDAITVESK